MPLTQMRPTYPEDDQVQSLEGVTFRTIMVPPHTNIEFKGDAGIPEPLLNLEQRLLTIIDQMQREGWTVPPVVLSYGFWAASASYEMQIDERGMVFFGITAAGMLPPDEFADLMATVSPEPFSRWRDWYTAPEGERLLKENRVTVSYLPDGQEIYWVNALSGATVPPDLERLLKRLADIYTRYQP